MNEQEYAQIVARNLRRIMNEHEKSQADLSRDLKISKATISSWVNGTRIPRMPNIDLLCHYFNVNRRDLMEEKEIQAFNNGTVLGKAARDPNQIKLLSNYQKLDDDKQGQLLQFSDALTLLP